MAQSIIEIAPNGDPYGGGFTACESTDGGESWFYRGDIGARSREYWRAYCNRHNATLRTSRVLWWVGCKADGTREAFGLPSDYRPEDTQWAAFKYVACIGPHKTKRGAQFMASWRAVNNPHCHNATAADRIAREMHARGETI